MRRAALLLCLVLIAAPRAAENWTYAATEHFEVYGTGGERQARDALTFFERVHSFFTDFLKLTPRTGAPTRLITFSSDRQFAPYKPNEVAAAFYLSAPDRDYIVMKSLDEDAHPIVVHEYAHLVFRRAGARYPVWLDEGLAEFFSTMSPDGSKMVIGRPLEQRLQLLTGGAAVLSMERLLAVGRSDPEYNTKSHAGVFYAQSWALTHMLLADARYKPKAGQLMSLVSKGTPGAAAFSTVYGKTLASVGADLINYVGRSQYTIFLAEYKTPPSLGKLATRPADAFEADLMTANLLANLPAREADAREALERLAGLKPNDVGLLESRAYLELHRGHHAAALPYFSRAVDAGSQSPKVYRDYATLDPARAEELLAKLVELAPEDVEARVWYASLLQTRRKSAEVIATLSPVADVPRDTGFTLYRLLANAYMQLDRVAEARTAAAQAEAFARTPAEAAEAARLGKTIQESALQRTLQTATPARPASAPASGQSSATSGPLALGSLLREPPKVVTGRIRNVECRSQGTPPVIEVATSKELLRLLVDNPLAITVQGRKDTTVDLRCGAQDVPIRIGYVPAVNGARQTIGNVRLLDYRTQ